MKGYNAKEKARMPIKRIECQRKGYNAKEKARIPIKDQNGNEWLEC